MNTVSRKTSIDSSVFGAWFLQNVCPTSRTSRDLYRIRLLIPLHLILAAYVPPRLVLVRHNSTQRRFTAWNDKARGR